jgi:hypothetical protein
MGEDAIRDDGRDDNIGPHHPSRNDYRGEGRIVDLPETAGPHSATGEAQEGTQRRSWLRRMFGR